MFAGCVVNRYDFYGFSMIRKKTSRKNFLRKNSPCWQNYPWHHDMKNPVAVIEIKRLFHSETKRRNVIADS